MLDEFEMTDIHLIAKDKGALEPTIKARLETAIRRSLDNRKEQFPLQNEEDIRNEGPCCTFPETIRR